MTDDRGSMIRNKFLYKTRGLASERGRDIFFVEKGREKKIDVAPGRCMKLCRDGVCLHHVL